MLRQLRAENRVPRSLPAAGDALPSYHISPAVPTWDTATQGEWSLVVDGAVRTPMRWSLGELRRLATRSQRVEHFCVEGWSAVVEWHGVPVTSLLRLARPLPDAGYVDFNSFDDGYHESWDLESVMHPQTLVALGKDGAPLSAAYGAPARVHSPVKLGYKNTKYLTRITLLSAPNGGHWSDQGYEWFGGT
jgi:DMSO/TMAO reductase YedYZ molybdopterin-dependent catalytic subunit